MNEREMAGIEAALKAYPLCRQIALFLIAHENAVDTLKGIADWWVKCDEVAVQAALDRLIACGLVTTHTLSSRTLYSLTRNAAIRTWLRTSYLPVEEPGRQPSNGDGQPAQGTQ